MKILAQAKNGNITMAIKDYEELNEVELNQLTFAYGKSKDDFVNYQVRYNKKGELLGVQAHDSNSTDTDVDPDIIDAMNVIYGNKQQASQAHAKYGKNAPTIKQARLAAKYLENEEA